MYTRKTSQIKTTPKLVFTGVKTGLLQRNCACNNSASLTGDYTECQNKRLTLQRFSGNQAEASEVPPIVHEVLKSPGQPLDANTRAFMELRFGHDFSQIRVHTDVKAAESALAVNALAYTVGQDIVFGAGQYAPNILAGQRLVAHELTHTIQQRAGVPPSLQHKIEISQPDAPSEMEADKMAGSFFNSRSFVRADHLPDTDKIKLMREEYKTQNSNNSDTKEVDFRAAYAGYFLTDAELKEANDFNVKVAKNTKPGLKPNEWLIKDPKIPNPEYIRAAQYFLNINIVRPNDIKLNDWREVNKDLGENFPTPLLQPFSIAVAGWQYNYLHNAEGKATVDEETQKEDIKVLVKVNNKEFQEKTKVVDQELQKKIKVDGKLAWDTVRAMTANGLLPTAQEWKVKDREEAKDIREQEKKYKQQAAYNNNSEDTQRQAIVDLAASQVGKVYAEGRGSLTKDKKLTTDGNKYGWERIVRYYEVAYVGKGKPEDRYKRELDLEGTPIGSARNNKEFEGIKAENRFANDTAPNLQKHSGAWSWCAIFPMWAIKTITGHGVWAGKDGPKDIGVQTSTGNDGKGLINAKRGDLLHIKNIKDSQLDHHVLLAQEVQLGDIHITTIEGNVEGQEIVYTRRRKVTDIDFYYPAIKH